VSRPNVGPAEPAGGRGGASERPVLEAEGPSPARRIRNASGRIGNFRAMVDFVGGNINLNWEQVPNPASTITLSPTRRDPLFGDPEVRLDWRITEPDLRTAALAIEYATKELTKLGYASGGTSNPTITAAGDHHMGATRMSADPRHGYVDANCRAHEVDNLYILSSSVFSTGGVSNPTLTIIALAARLGAHLARL
jgi:choline dehydrogenase-like flavoprotein